MPSHGYLAYTQGKGVQGGCKPPAFFNANFSDDSDPAPPGCAVASSALYKGRARADGETHYRSTVTPVVPQHTKKCASIFTRCRGFSPAWGLGRAAPCSSPAAVPTAKGRARDEGEPPGENLHRSTGRSVFLPVPSEKSELSEKNPKKLFSCLRFCKRVL